jgi:hypothetical protein
MKLVVASFNMDQESIWANGFVTQIVLRDVPVEVEKVGACMCLSAEAFC